MRARTPAIALVTIALLAGCTTSPGKSPSLPAGPAPSATTSHQTPEPTGTSTAGALSGSTTAPSAGAEVDDAAGDDEQAAPPVPATGAAAQADALARAEGFVRAWARPNLDATTWFNGLRGFLSPAAAEGFIWTDPTAVPATTVTGAPTFLEEPTATSARVVVPTDAGDQYVLLVHPDDQTPWQVAVLATDAQGLEQ